VFAILGVALVPVVVLWLAGLIPPAAAGLSALGVVSLAYLMGSWLAAPRKREPEMDAPSPLYDWPQVAGERELEALIQVSQAAGLMTKPAQLYRWLTQRLANLVQAEKCALIFRRLDDVNAFQVMAPTYGYTLQETSVLSQSIADGYGADKRTAPLPSEQNIMLTPLKIGHKRVGAIRLANKQGGFSADDVQLVDFLADRLGVALENSRIYQIVQRRLEEMSLLYEVAVPLAGAPDFDEAVSRAIQAIQSMLGCEQVNLFLVDEGSETLHLHGASPLQASGARDIRVPLGKGVIGRVAETGELANVADVRGKTDVLALVPGLRSELCIPLKLGSWVIGVIDAQANQPHAFEDKDVRLLGIVAGQLAAVLQSARLYEATRQRAAELSSLYDATVAISTAELDRTGIIKLVMERLISAVQVDGGRLALWDSATSTLATRFVSGPTLTGKTQMAPLVDVYFQRHLLTSRKPLTLYQGEPRLDGGVAQAMRSQAIRSALVLPLVTHNRVIGLVELTRRVARHRFQPEEVRLALTLATQAAIALENARLYQETKRAVEELAVLQALALDITAQVALPELLDRLTMRARHLVNAAGSAIYLLDSPESGLALAASDLSWGEDNHLVIRLGLALAQQVMENVRPLCQPVGPLLGEDGVTLSCACVPLRWGEQVVGVLSVFRPKAEKPFAAQELYLLELLAPQAAIAISNVQLYQELDLGMQELEQAQANLIQAEKAAAIGRLAASLAHEINNPLQSLNNCLHLSLRPDLSLEKKGLYLGLAQEEVERLIAIVNRMLNFYRPTTGEKRSETDVAQLLQDVLALVNKQLEHGKIETELNLASDLPPILAIPNNLRQVFLNLILNAVDAMPDGGRLTITTQMLDEGQVGITIRDDGRGIPAEDLSHIYEPFFTTKEHGTGLGLPISYGIVEAHNGQMQVESVVGKGTTFSLRFPVGGAGNG